jgi:DNA recombination protein RmuC
MIEILAATVVTLLLVVIVLQFLLLSRTSTTTNLPVMTRVESVERAIERTERGLKDEIVRSRDELNVVARDLREEVQGSLRLSSELLARSVDAASSAQSDRLEDLSKQLASLTQSVASDASILRGELSSALHSSKETLDKRLSENTSHLQARLDSFGERLSAFSDANQSSASETRAELASVLTASRDSIQKQMIEMTSLQKQQLDSFAVHIADMTDRNDRGASELRRSVEGKLTQIQTDTATKLEEMRRTVDEKLQGTLEKRLGESFKQVSDRLELVHQGLGEMQVLASGVGDLKRVLTNVKTRGTWGEIQLGNLLEQILTTEQYSRNVKTNPVGNEVVEFAIKLPGPDGHGSKAVWLPIDAKFPKESYERLVDAAERSDQVGVDHATKELESFVRTQARSIHDKHLFPPYTTDFGLLYLPTEGLYAEVVRRPGLIEVLQREHRIVVVGPTTLAALLNSLQMGFRTLAIQERSSEVWKVLGAVKADFGKFTDLLDKVKKKIEETGNTIEDAAHRSRQIEKKLRKVEATSAEESAPVTSPIAGALSKELSELPD